MNQKRGSLRFRDLQHNLFFSLCVSPLPQNRELEYPPRSYTDALQKSKELGTFLCELVKDLYNGYNGYNGAEIIPEINESKRCEPPAASITDWTGKVLAQFYFEIQPYNANNKNREDFTPVAFLDMGVKDYPLIHRLMSSLFDKVALRKRGKIKTGQDEIDYFALLSQLEPTKIERDSYCTDKELFRRIGFDLGRCRIYD